MKSKNSSSDEQLNVTHDTHLSSSYNHSSAFEKVLVTPKNSNPKVTDLTAKEPVSNLDRRRNSQDLQELNKSNCRWSPCKSTSFLRRMIRTNKEDYEYPQNTSFCKQTSSNRQDATSPKNQRKQQKATLKTNLDNPEIDISNVKKVRTRKTFVRPKNSDRWDNENLNQKSTDPKYIADMNDDPSTAQTSLIISQTDPSSSYKIDPFYGKISKKHEILPRLSEALENDDTHSISSDSGQSSGGSEILNETSLGPGNNTTWIADPSKMNSTENIITSGSVSPHKITKSVRHRMLPKSRNDNKSRTDKSNIDSVDELSMDDPTTTHPTTSTYENFFRDKRYKDAKNASTYPEKIPVSKLLQKMKMNELVGQLRNSLRAREITCGSKKDRSQNNSPATSPSPVLEKQSHNSHTDSEVEDEPSTSEVLDTIKEVPTIIEQQEALNNSKNNLSKVLKQKAQAGAKTGPTPRRNANNNSGKNSKYHSFRHSPYQNPDKSTITDVTIHRTSSEQTGLSGFSEFDHDQNLLTSIKEETEHLEPDRSKSTTTSRSNSQKTIKTKRYRLESRSKSDIRHCDWNRKSTDTNTFAGHSQFVTNTCTTRSDSMTLNNLDTVASFGRLATVDRLMSNFTLDSVEMAPAGRHNSNQSNQASNHLDQGSSKSQFSSFRSEKSSNFDSSFERAPPESKRAMINDYYEMLVHAHPNSDSRDAWTDDPNTTFEDDTYKGLSCVLEENTEDLISYMRSEFGNHNNSNLKHTNLSRETTRASKKGSVNSKVIKNQNQNNLTRFEQTC